MHSKGLLAGEIQHSGMVEEHLPLIVLATSSRIYVKDFQGLGTSADCRLLSCR